MLTAGVNEVEVLEVASVGFVCVAWESVRNSSKSKSLKLNKHVSALKVLLLSDYLTVFFFLNFLFIPFDSRIALLAVAALCYSAYQYSDNKHSKEELT